MHLTQDQMRIMFEQGYEVEDVVMAAGLGLGNIGQQAIKLVKAAREAKRRCYHNLCRNGHCVECGARI